MNGSPPPAKPNFREAAQLQGDENLRAATTQSGLNNPNFYGIGGQQTVTYGPDGRPTVQQSLSPEQQALYSQYTQNQLGAGGAASRLLGQIGYGLDINGLPARGSPLKPDSLPAMPGQYGDVRQSVIDAMMGRADQRFGQQEDQMNSDLVARGLSPGTEAYSREMERIDQSRNDAYQQAEIAGGDAATQAIQADLARRGLAGAEQGQQFGQFTTNRGMGLTEQMQAAQLPMSQFAALMNGSQFQMPNLPGYQGNTQVAPAPLYGAATADSNYDVDLWNAATQLQNSNNTGLFGIGNSIINSPSAMGLLGRGVGSVWDYFTRPRSAA